MSDSEGMFRRIQMLFGRGRITHVDDSGPVQVIQVKMNGLEVPDNRLRLAEFGFTSNPPIGSDVLALHMAGDRSAGAVVSTNNQQARPKGLLSGETMLYSQDGKYVYMTASGGIVVEAKGQPVTINDASNVTVNCSGILKVVAPGGVQFQTPTVTVTGVLNIENQAGATNASTMTGSFEVSGDVIAGSVSTQNHIHSASGGSGNGGPPVPGT